MWLPILALAAAAQVPTFPTGTELVYLRFHVEKKGASVTTISKDQLRVLEDGKPQPIVVLETPSSQERRVLPEVTLMLDVSSSVLDERLLDEALVREVLLGSLQAGSRVGLCAFAGELQCFTELTTEPMELMAGFREAIRYGHATRRSGTRLYASVADVARAKVERPSQRALILFTDALDNQGGKVGDAVDAALAADVRVYAVKLSQAFQDTARPFGRGVPDRTMYDYKKLELDALPDATGGKAFEPGTLDGSTMTKILREIATDIRDELVVGYEPQGPPQQKKRKVKVELVDKSVGKIREGERTIVR